MHALPQDNTFAGSNRRLGSLTDSPTCVCVFDLIFAIACCSFVTCRLSAQDRMLHLQRVFLLPTRDVVVRLGAQLLCCADIFFVTVSFIPDSPSTFSRGAIIFVHPEPSLLTLPRVQRPHRSTRLPRQPGRHRHWLVKHHWQTRKRWPRFYGTK